MSRPVLVRCQGWAALGGESASSRFICQRVGAGDCGAGHGERDDERENGGAERGGLYAARAGETAAVTPRRPGGGYGGSITE